MKTGLELQNRGYSNASGYTPSKEEIEASQKLTEALISNNAAKKAMEAQTGCHKPTFNVGKKKAAYKRCLEASAKLKQDTINAQIALAEASKNSEKKIATIQPEKLLGMPKDIAIPVLVIGSAGLLFLGYKLFLK